MEEVEPRLKILARQVKVEQRQELELIAGKSGAVLRLSCVINQVG